MDRKWVMLYEYYKSDNAQERIAYLKERIDNGQATSEEQKEYDKMQKAMNNLQKIGNIKNAIEALETNLDILKEEHNNRKDNAIIDRMEKEVTKLEKEIEEKRTEAKKMHDENDDYWKKVFEVQNMEDTLKSLKDELSETTKKQSNNSELARLSKQELRKEIFNTAAQISKCNVAAELYIRGESDKTINLAIKKDTHYKKFTAKDPLPKSRKEREPGKKAKITRNVEIQRENQPISGNIENTVTHEGTGREIIQDPITVIQAEPTGGTVEHTTALVDYKSIIKQHPILERMTKIPLLKKFAKNRLNKIVEEAYKNRKNSVIQQMGEEIIEEPAEKRETKREKFIRGLSSFDVLDIAEKGIESLEEQRKKDKLLEAKERAILTQDRKFSKPGKLSYSERSGDNTQVKAKFLNDEER